MFGQIVNKPKPEKPIDQFADKVTCEECKCWLNKCDAWKVQYPIGQLFYCGAHKKPYSRVHLPSFYGVDGEPTFYGEVQMDNDGTPVGYKKITK